MKATAAKLAFNVNAKAWATACQIYLPNPADVVVWRAEQRGAAPAMQQAEMRGVSQKV